MTNKQASDGRQAHEQVAGGDRTFIEVSSAVSNCPEVAVIKKRKARAEAWSTFRGAIVKALVFVLIIVAVFTWVFGLVRVQGNGMSPSIGDGDLALTTRIVDGLEANDLIAFEHDGDMLIGRVVALPGDTVEIRNDGTFVVNGTEQTSLTAERTLPGSADVSYPLTLGEGQYFVLGDSRTQAKDSRDVGPIDVSEVKGKIIAVLRLRDI
ncbi:MAG: signal peptidase I [Coriobacteriales bacterium]|jgi:signal peptidase I